MVYIRRPAMSSVHKLRVSTKKKTLMAPPFWVVHEPDLSKKLKSISQKGTISLLSLSAGKRKILLYSIGTPKNLERTANLSSASGSDDPTAYFAKQKPNYKQTLFILAGIHGQETEATAGAINLISIIETGRDLRGQAWPKIAKYSKHFRLLIIPNANPDGRARIGIPSLVGRTNRDSVYYGQGMWKNGKLITWAGSKRYFPLPLKKVAFSGGYPNDKGVNLMHDASPSGLVAPETRALFKLVEDEKVDCCLNMHGHQRGPSFIPVDFGSADMEKRFREISHRGFLRFKKEKLRPLDPKVLSRSGSFNMCSAMHHTSGCLSLLFESPYGIVEIPYTYDELLDIQLIAIEETMRFGIEKRFRPEI
jgi:hypothetical protein